MQQDLLAAQPADEQAFAGSTSRVVRRLLRQRRFQVGVVLLAFILTIVVFGSVLAPFDVRAIGLGLPGAAPSAQHPLGLDGIGRDVLSRVLEGGGHIIVVSASADAIAFVLATSIALICAYRGGWLSVTVTRGVDVLLAVPALLLVFILVDVFGDSSLIIATVVVLAIIPTSVRVIRGMSEAVLRSDYVLAARARGERTSYILVGEVLPNIVRPLLALAALGLSGALATVASLGFLGLGTHPPQPDWGAMVAENNSVITTNPWAVLVPAFAMCMLVLGTTLIADALADVFANEDTRRRRARRHGRRSP